MKTVKSSRSYIESCYSVSDSFLKNKPRELDGTTRLRQQCVEAFAVNSGEEDFWETDLALTPVDPQLGLVQHSEELTQVMFMLVVTVRKDKDVVLGRPERKEAF